MKKLCLVICAGLLLAACSSAEKTGTSTAATNSGNSASSNITNTPAKPESSPATDPNMQATFPYKDFPAVETTAKPGEVVLVPSYNWLQDANTKGADKTSMIWYQQTMSAPDKEMSEVQF